ncbi:hypothetical protein M405DRAFT_841812 [Rhizopogon salebrosus TDB-379]|nr:hypothetical protein M405DRAFT_841812 [Rhizopogon salebrosus TDB-379]
MTRWPKIKLKMKPEISRVAWNKNKWHTLTDEAVVIKYLPYPPKHHIAAKGNVSRPKTGIVIVRVVVIVAIIGKIGLSYRTEQKEGFQMEFKKMEVVNVVVLSSLKTAKVMIKMLLITHG